jgi:hypothetical protein
MVVKFLISLQMIDSKSRKKNVLFFMNLSFEEIKNLTLPMKIR